MNREKLISSFNRLNQSFDESKSYFFYSNNKQSTKKYLYSGFYKKKNYFYIKNTIKEDKYQKKQIIKKKTIELNNNNRLNISEKNSELNIICNENKMIKNESNDNLTDESTLYQSQKSINENSSTKANSIILIDEYDKKQLIKNTNIKNDKIRQKNLRTKSIVLNFKNKLHYSRIPNLNNNQFNKFNVNSCNTKITNSTIFENTLILSVKIKVDKDKFVFYNLRKYDDLFISMKLFCKLNHINEILVKCLIIQILKTLNNVYKISNYLLTQRDINYLFNIKTFVNC